MSKSFCGVVNMCDLLENLSLSCQSHSSVSTRSSHIVGVYTRNNDRQQNNSDCGGRELTLQPCLDTSVVETGRSRQAY